jgi:Ca2+-binding EF-hand superfamily protein
VNDFCTRERFVEFFNEVVHAKGGRFTDEEVDSILNELDPYYTGIIQIQLI